MNFTLHRGSPFANDVELYEDGVIRIYDVLFRRPSCSRPIRTSAISSSAAG
jgi:deoxyhypusine synthase